MGATFRTSQPGSVADPRRPHIILVGLPGSGKSTVGAGVAERLGRNFLDYDREIEHREGKSIGQIFAEQGEHAFRALEKTLTEELALLGNMVLAPGGGWITSPEVVALLRPPGRLIYLKVRPETAIKRLGPEGATRPLLSRPDPLGELRRLLEQRHTLYEQADATVDTEHLKPQEVIQKVTELASVGGAGYVTR
jgi:shikimate kinase